MKSFDDFRLASHAPLTEAELGWIDMLRAIHPRGVPKPDLRSVQLLRAAKNPVHCMGSSDFHF